MIHHLNKYKIELLMRKCSRENRVGIVRQKMYLNDCMLTEDVHDVVWFILSLTNMVILADTLMIFFYFAIECKNAKRVYKLYILVL